MKKSGALGVAKMVYDEARKPHNQAKLKDATRKGQEHQGTRQERLRLDPRPLAWRGRPMPGR